MRKVQLLMLHHNIDNPYFTLNEELKGVFFEHPAEK